MKIIYAKKSSGIEGPGSFQNPEYYLGPDHEAKSVVIHGDYPHIKADYEKLGIDVEVYELPKPEPLTVSVKVGVTPELQAAIDEAKAECEKVQAKNEELEDQLATAHAELIAFKNDVPAMQARIDELDHDWPKEELTESAGSYDEMTAGQLREALNQKGIAYKTNDLKPKLIELLNSTTE